MDRHLKKYLQDIVDSIDAIDTYLQGNRNYFFYLQNKMVRRSIERELEIIGEAMNRVLKMHPDINITSATKIVDQRNLIIHAYDSVNDGMIWGVVIKHLPKLREEVTALLGEVS